MATSQSFCYQREMRKESDNDGDDDDDDHLDHDDKQQQQQQFQEGRAIPAYVCAPLSFSLLRITVCLVCYFKVFTL